MLPRHQNFSCLLMPLIKMIALLGLSSSYKLKHFIQSTRPHHEFMNMLRSRFKSFLPNRTKRIIAKSISVFLKFKKQNTPEL